MAITLGELTMGIAYSLNQFSETQFYIPHTFFVIAGYAGTWTWRFNLAIIPGACYLLIAKMLFPPIDPPEVYNFVEVFERNKIFIYLFTGLFMITNNLAIALIYKIRNWKVVMLNGLVIVIILIISIIDLRVWDLVLSVLLLSAMIGFNLIFPLKIIDKK